MDVAIALAEDPPFWQRPTWLSGSEEPGMVSFPFIMAATVADGIDGTTYWVDLAKDNWKVIGTGLAVLSLASVGLYAIFKTRKEAKKDNLTFLSEAELQTKVTRAQKAKSRQNNDWLLLIAVDLYSLLKTYVSQLSCSDRDMWKRVDDEPIDAALDSVYDYLDGKPALDMENMDAATLSSEVPSLGLKDVYISPSKKAIPFSPKGKDLASPNRVRVRDLLAEYESKSAMLREAEATIERQSVVIKRNNDNYEELTLRFKTEQRFRIEAEHQSRLMEEQLDKLQELLDEQQNVKLALESELKAANLRSELAASSASGEESQRSLQIFDELRKQHLSVQEEVTRIKALYERVTSEKMQEKGYKEVYMRQVTQLVAEIDELQSKLQSKGSSPYVHSGSYGARAAAIADTNNDSYFSPIQKDQGPKAMGFSIPPAAEIMRSRVQNSEAAANLPPPSYTSLTNPYINSSSIVRNQEETTESSLNGSSGNYLNDSYDSPLELTEELEELLSRTK